MTYDEFRKEFEQQHPASIPVVPSRVSSDYPRWLRAAVLVMFACAALLSGVHTVPTVYAGIESTHVADWVRQVVSLAAFVAIDLALFVATYARLRGNRRTVSVMLAVVFAVALISNVNSVLRALSAQGDVWTTVVGVILGFGAPLIALLAGELFVHMHAAGSEADAKAWTDYREAQRQFDAMVLREYRRRKLSRDVSARTADTPDSGQPTLSERTEEERTPSLPEPQSLARAGYGYDRTADAMHKAMDWLDAHPDQADGSLRALAGQIGVGKSTVGEARQEWYRQQRLAQAASTNGHGEPV